MEFYNEKVDGNQKTWTVSFGIKNENNANTIQNMSDYELVQHIKRKPIEEWTKEETLKIELYRNYVYWFSTVISKKSKLENSLKFNKSKYEETGDDKYALEFKICQEKLKSIKKFIDNNYDVYGLHNKITSDAVDNLKWFWNSGKLRNLSELYYNSSEFLSKECVAEDKARFWFVIGFFLPFILGFIVAICERGITPETFFGVLFLGFFYGAVSFPITFPLGLLLGSAIGKARRDGYIESHKPEFVTEEDPNKTDGSEILAAVAIGAVAGASSAKNLKGGWIKK